MNAPPVAAHPRLRAGFTLVETMIVLVLMGVLMGMMAPRMNEYFNRLKVDAAVDQLVTDVSFARMLAVRQGMAVEMVVQDGGRYVIREAGSLVIRKTGSLRDHADDLEVVGYSGGAQVDLTLHPLTFVFDRRGLIGAGADQRVVVSRGAHQATLAVTGIGRAYREY
jgi:prepilin-type N-terminal cleavage/methylation domain-containing protein